MKVYGNHAIAATEFFKPGDVVFFLGAVMNDDGSVSIRKNQWIQVIVCVMLIIKSPALHVYYF